MIASITASSFASLAAFSFLSAIFAFTDSLYSATVSNSETSEAKSSSTSGNSFTLISFTVHLNTAGFPAKLSA